ncbi:MULTISPECIES: lipopolysaccharide assembly protein LapA domain-containing protein [Idiomarinaceae]|nr:MULTISPECIES: LapA family protein [Idiomarinaceae]MRJ40727.1 DUF1049 domain-containing protein [Idiomarina sp. FeN1]NCU56531.1 DUF1049 domain-containing protein [Idiomarina sp. FenA--70]MDX1525001.1 LapA family protein [Pseudidiomarina maritima]NCU58911.1 DUF1049 domain-containing protein [Idiomarina sp. FenBw--71]UUN14585.1 LapA family protein [Idiomarina loihiensis]
MKTRPVTMIRFLFVSLPLLILFLIAIAFGAMNNTPVTVDFLAVQQQVSLALVAALFLALGFIIGVIAMLARQFLLGREIKKLRKQLVKTSTP